MPVNITVGDGVIVRSTDLPASVVSAIAKENDTNWVHVTEVPLAGDGAVASAVYAAALRQAGLPPEPAVTWGTIKAAIADIPPEVASLPVEFDGGLPSPLDEDSSLSTT